MVCQFLVHARRSQNDGYLDFKLFQWRICCVNLWYGSRRTGSISHPFQTCAGVNFVTGERLYHTSAC